MFYTYHHRSIIAVCVLIYAVRLGKGQRGFLTVPEVSRNRIKAFLECGPKLMVMKMYFNNSIFREFNDWIVVGLNNRLECRQQGNGDLQYLIEIPLTNEPCGTKMVEPNNYENIVSIKKHPLLILEGDEVINLRCTYGLQEIGSLSGPSLSGSQELAPQAVPTVPFPIIVASSSISPVLASGTIYIIVFLLLFLLLLCLLCCCACFIMRRRRKRMEKRKKIFLSVPQSSELNKLGIAHLWWTGKASNSNDALLSHDYMISSNSTRDHLSISTEYPNDTTPTDSSGSPNAIPQQASYNLDAKHTIPRVRLDPAIASRPSDGNQVYAADETGRRSHFKNPSIGKNLRSMNTVQNAWYENDVVDADSRPNSSTVYAHVNAGQKSARQASKSNDEKTVGATGGDNEHSPSTLVKADIHANNGDVEGEKIRKNLIDLDVIIRAIEQNKNLTDADLKKLYKLVEKDKRIQELFCRSKTFEDFVAISRMAEYKNLYNADKWSQICRSLTEAVQLQLSPPATSSLRAVSPGLDDGASFSSSDSDTIRQNRPETYERSKDNESTSTDNSMAADRSTTEFVEPAQIYQQAENYRLLVPTLGGADLLSRTPVLNVYLGNVPNRSINVQYQSNVNANVNGYYYREVNGNNWDESSIYGLPEIAALAPKCN